MKIKSPLLLLALAAALLGRPLAAATFPPVATQAVTTDSLGSLLTGTLSSKTTSFVDLRLGTVLLPDLSAKYLSLAGGTVTGSTVFSGSLNLPLVVGIGAGNVSYGLWGAGIYGLGNLQLSLVGNSLTISNGVSGLNVYSASGMVTLTGGGGLVFNGYTLSLSAAGTLGTMAFDSGHYLPLAGGTLTGGLTISGSLSGAAIVNTEVTTTAGGGIAFWNSSGTLSATAAFANNNALLLTGTISGGGPVQLANGSSSQVLHGNTTLGAAPTWGAVILTSQVSGILPVANGGTNTTSALGSMAFDSGGPYLPLAGGTLTGSLSTATVAGLSVITGTLGSPLLSLLDGGSTTVSLQISSPDNSDVTLGTTGSGVTMNLSPTGALSLTPGANIGLVAGSGGINLTAFAGSSISLNSGKVVITNAHSQSFSAWGLAGIYVKLQPITVTDSSTATSSATALETFFSIAAPTLKALNTGVTTTAAATFYIGGAPIAGTNQTITNDYALDVAAGLTNLGGGANTTTLSVTSSLASTNSTTGAIVDSGGLGVAGAIFGTTASFTTVTTGAIVGPSATNTITFGNGSTMQFGSSGGGFVFNSTLIMNGDISVGTPTGPHLRSNGTGNNILILGSAVSGFGSGLNFGGATASYSAFTSDAVNDLQVVSGAMGTTWNDASTTTASTVADRFIFAIAAPTLTASNHVVTYSAASTFEVGGAPTSATTSLVIGVPYSVNVKSGMTQLAGGHLDGNTTVSALPTATTSAGFLGSPGVMRTVTDSSVTVSSTTVGTAPSGSGSNTVPVFSTGSAWIIP